ncbi:hypothetical protein FOB72_21770 [Cupriavidus pauculus]|uniref:Uncharacterized protein n=1 Tax=Cupriavidus pauculus TaxID=82633 RepID=A0A5P2H958_9BURK|nr:hypothetical protein [Cupriavidus pauculus]QET04727.1 hypothetical protein FOB72_21770 [Cupriavidus pauculus]
MSLSVPQRRLVHLLNSGAQLRIVRSVLNRSPVYCELSPANASGPIEIIPMWRIRKLLATNAVRLDTGDMATAREIVLATRPAPGDDNGGNGQKDLPDT